MSDKPIVFSDTMMLALGDGRKTQTRRILNPQPAFHGLDDFLSLPVRRPFTFAKFLPISSENIDACTPYQIGDRLYVREAWAGVSVGGNSIDTIFYKSVGASSLWFNKGTPTHLNFVEQKRSQFSAHPKKWGPRTRMPRVFSRMTLIVTDVQVQRLQDISAEDAIAEGLKWVTPTYGIPGLANTWTGDPRASYAALWNTINGAGSWEANPWVMAIRFTVHHCNISKMERP